MLETFNYEDQWPILGKIDVFRTKTTFNNEAEYRQNHMSIVAAAHRSLSLERIIAYEHASVCWSQTPFVILPPSSEVLGELSVPLFAHSSFRQKTIQLKLALGSRAVSSFLGSS